MRLRPVTLVVTFALGLLAGPLPAEAQQAGKIHRIGYLSVGRPDQDRNWRPWPNIISWNCANLYLLPTLQNRETLKDHMIIVWHSFCLY